MLIEHSWYSYNSRRYGNPWAAKVRFDGVKPKYDFVGRYAAGRLAFEAEPGDLIAMGQKDHRGNKASRDMYEVQSDKSLRPIDEAEALHLWRGRSAPPTPATEGLAVPCRWCGEPTKLTATRQCSEHWEMFRHIRHEPDIALQMLRSLELESEGQGEQA